MASTLLQERGYATQSFHPRQITSASMHDTTAEIQKGKYNLIWIDFPTNGRSLHPGKRAASIRQLALWMRLAVQVSVMCVMIGLRGHHWQDDNLQALIADKVLYEATHHLCHYNIKVSNDTDQPSDVKLHAYTSFPDSASLCRCPVGQEHTYELKAIQKVPGRAHIWPTACKEMYKNMMSK